MRNIAAAFALSIAALPALAQDFADMPTSEIMAEIAYLTGLSSPAIFDGTNRRVISRAFTQVAVCRGLDIDDFRAFATSVDQALAPFMRHEIFATISDMNYNSQLTIGCGVDPDDKARTVALFNTINLNAMILVQVRARSQALADRFFSSPAPNNVDGLLADVVALPLAD